MRKIYDWWSERSKRMKDSLAFSAATVGLISSFLTILGVSLENLRELDLWVRLCIVIGMYGGLAVLFYFIIGWIFHDSIQLTIRQTPVSIRQGNIFEELGLRVIGCDTHFDSRIDDIVISRNSLHGELFLRHGEKERIEEAVRTCADRLELDKNEAKQYDFPLGSIVVYENQNEDCTYLLLAMTELGADGSARTSMAQFEQMLMNMWREIDRVYAGRHVCLPLLGTGITRFTDGPEDESEILRCMLCTLNTSGVRLNAGISIILHDIKKDIDLYEYGTQYHITPRR